VNETDIGKVRPGLPASVTVDAFPDRPFAGTVEKIEPQATIQQAVTMFPVLVSIDNVSGLLMPGMNGEVSIEVERRDNALAVSNDAVRSPNEVVSVATMLGLNPDSVRALLFSGRGGQGGGAPQGGGAASQGGAPSGDGAARGGRRATPASQTGPGGAPTMAQVTDEQCTAITAALAKKPEVQAKIAELRTKMMSGEIEREAMQTETQKLYASAGVDPAAARSCLFRARSQGGASGGRAGGGAQGGAQAAGSQEGGGGFRGGQRAGGRRGMVFLVDNGKYIPKVVRLGVSNFDVSEVVSGLNEGDSVAILNVAAMQARQQEEMDRMRSRSGMPGMQRQQPQGGQGGQGGAGGAQGGQRPGGNNR
jgi:HlyD family secretion protein